MMVHLQLTALMTLFRKELVRFLRIWTQTLIPPAITMSLYFVIFGKFIGSQLPLIHGYHYIQYIVPGLIMMSIITNAYSNTSSSFFLTKFNKSIEEMLVSPMFNVVILLGFTLGGMLRGLVVGLIVFLIALIFTDVPIKHVGIVIMMSVLASLLFSLAGLINGIFARNFDDIAFIPTFILTPLTYLGGVFFSLQQLPLYWQQLSVLNPIFEMVNSFRYGLLNVSDSDPYVGIVLIVGLIIVTFVYALYLLRIGVGIKA
jgi:ABC-2 type transport system permease protein